MSSHRFFKKHPNGEKVRHRSGRSTGLSLPRSQIRCWDSGLPIGIDAAFALPHSVDWRLFEEWWRSIAYVYKVYKCKEVYLIVEKALHIFIVLNLGIFGHPSLFNSWRKAYLFCRNYKDLNPGFGVPTSPSQPPDWMPHCHFLTQLMNITNYHHEIMHGPPLIGECFVIMVYDIGNCCCPIHVFENVGIGWWIILAWRRDNPTREHQVCR